MRKILTKVCTTTTIQDKKDCYYYSPILDIDNFYHSHDNNNHPQHALREIYPNVSLGCFIKKPVSIEYLIKRLSAELD